MPDALFAWLRKAAFAYAREKAGLNGQREWLTLPGAEDSAPADRGIIKKPERPDSLIHFRIFDIMDKKVCNLWKKVMEFEGTLAQN